MASGTRAQQPSVDSLLNLLRQGDLQAALDGDYSIEKLQEVTRNYAADPSTLPPRPSTQDQASQHTVEIQRNSTQSNTAKPQDTVLVLKLRKEVTNIAETSDFGTKFKNKKLSRHSVLTDIFMFFMCIVTVLQELNLGNGTAFSVLDFVTGSYDTETYTPMVWTLIESLCRTYVQESSRTINNAKRTIETLRLSAKLHTKLQRIILLRDLQIAARKDPLDFHKWDLIEQFIAVLKLEHQDMLMVQMLESLPVVIWEKIKLKISLGQELTKTLVEESITDVNFRLDGGELPDLTPRGQTDGEVQRYKKTIQDLRKQLDAARRKLPPPAPKLQKVRMPSGLEQCKICTRLHEGECPWANSRCRWCCQLHAEDHPIWGHCTREKQQVRRFQTEDGRVVESVPFSNRGKGFPSFKQPKANVKPRLMKLGRAEKRTRAQVNPLPLKNVKSDTSLPATIPMSTPEKNIPRTAEDGGAASSTEPLMDMSQNKDMPDRKTEEEDGENKAKILEAKGDPAPADKEDQRDAAKLEAPGRGIEQEECERKVTKLEGIEQEEYERQVTKLEGDPDPVPIDKEEQSDRETAKAKETNEEPRVKTPVCNDSRGWSKLNNTQRQKDERRGREKVNIKNMEAGTAPLKSLGYKNWLKKSDVRKRGVVKFYSKTRGKGKSKKADLQWGFIQPLQEGTNKADKNAPDIHFTLMALRDVPESVVKKDLVVEYTVMPDSNSASTVDAVYYDPKTGTSDTGAWMHVHKHKNDLVNFRWLEQPIPVGTAKDGDWVFLRGIGDLVVRVDGQVTVFKNVFYAPECSSTLLSVRLMTKFGGWTLHADEHETTLTHGRTGQQISLDDNFQFEYTQADVAVQPYRPKTKMTQAEVRNLPGLDFIKDAGNIKMVNTMTEQRNVDMMKGGRLVGYMAHGIMEFRPIEFKDDRSMCKWHRRLGHAHINHVKQVAAQQGIKLTGKLGEFACETCALSKIAQRISTTPRDHAKKFLDRVHADIIGPINPVSHSGHKYALILVDCKTRHPYIYCQPNKESQTTQTNLKRFCTDVQGKPKELRIDGGSEFQGVCEAWCAQQGVKVSLSPPYAHYLNGVVERKIRAIKEMTRCLLNHSRLPAMFWNDAMETAVYLISRLPTRALPDNITPYQARWNKLPKVDHLKVFGSKVIFRQGAGHDASDVSKALQDKGREGIMIGFEGKYNTGTYKIWDTQTHQVVHSNQVQFFEEQTIQDTMAKHAFDDEQYEAEFSVDDDYLPDLADDDDEDEDMDMDLDMNRRLPPSETADVQPKNILKGKRSRKQTDRYNPMVEAARRQWGSINQLASPNIFLNPGIVKGEDMISPDIPRNDLAALNDPIHGAKWTEALDKELAQFEKFDTYTEISRDEVPLGAQILPTHFIRTIKRCGKFKYRLVAAGNHQIGEASYSPTAALTALRMIIGKCNNEGYRLRQADISAAYLQSPIDDDVYVRPPPDPRIDPTLRKNKVWKLKKAMYGLRKSPKYWHTTVTNAMRNFGLQPTSFDPCIFSCQGLIVGVWVDDFIYGGTPEMQQKFEEYLRSTFSCEAPQDAADFCGIDIEQRNGVVTLSQKRYIEKVLKQFDIPPRNVKSPLIRQLLPHDDKVDPEIKFRELLGALMFIMIATRPNIAFAVHHLSRFGQSYGPQHYEAAMRVAQYVHNTRDYVLEFKQTKHPILVAYSDASWAACTFSRKSTSGRIVLYGGTPISWASKLQQAVATSSTESELYALTDTVKEVLYLRILLEDLNSPMHVPTEIHCDNQATIALCTGRDQPLKRVRHLRPLKRFLDIRRKFIQTQKPDVYVRYCPTKDNIADQMTKPFGPTKQGQWEEQIRMLKHGTGGGC